MTQSEKVKTITKILKRKFPQLTSIELVGVAYNILEALDKAEQKELGGGKISIPKDEASNG